MESITIITTLTVLVWQIEFMGIACLLPTLTNRLNTFSGVIYLDKTHLEKHLDLYRVHKKESIVGNVYKCRERSLFLIKYCNSK